MGPQIELALKPFRTFLAVVSAEAWQVLDGLGVLELGQMVVGL
jgi:hypothetical protein